MKRFIQRTSSHPRSWLRVLICGGAVGAALIGTARADDSEIFISQNSAAPNIMLILDTSGSMQTTVTSPVAFDAAEKYVSRASGDCGKIAGRVFYSTDGKTPTCNSNYYFTATNNRCQKAKTALEATDSPGFYQGDQFTQWRTDGGTKSRWRLLKEGYRTPVDCYKDNGVDGDLKATAPYPDRNASVESNTARWTNAANDSFWTSASSGTSATLYSAEYIAYYEKFRTVSTGSTRLQVMQRAATDLLKAVSNVNVGLMRYSVNTKDAAAGQPGNGGGMVVAPVAPIETNREQLIGLINNFIPGGYTPLSEALYEAHQYFSGGSVFFGNTSQVCKSATSGVCNDKDSMNYFSVASSRAGGTASSPNYASPSTQVCQKNYIVYLTDGEPNLDTKANAKITGLPGYSTLVGTTCAAGSNGVCLAPLSEYMFKRDLRPGLDGQQNVVSYYIGFGDTFGSGTSNAAFNYLVDAAQKGGGQAYAAGNLSELTQVFTNIFNSISKDSATGTAPTVAVNAFNRTRTLNDLYISVFQPTGQLHWPGNVKKFRLDDEDGIDIQALDATGKKVSALDNKGMFLDSVSDFWSKSSADGAKVEMGGAANMIPKPANRKLYTDIEASLSEVKVDNDKIDDKMLGTDATNPDRETLIKWARGADVDDEDKDGDKEEPRYDMGDPLHSQPAAVIYGGTTDKKDAEDAVVYTATNDGYLHAFSSKTGEELWAYIPKEMLPGLKALYVNDSSTGKNYSLDGDLRVLKYDINGDGIVDPAKDDRVLLFFSTGRNQTVSRYYALDVTSKTEPKFLWSIGPTELPGLGQAWSRPAFTRVNVTDKTQNTQKLVLIVGGGYDDAEEGGGFIDKSDVGNRVFMIDALYGTLLWSAGDTGTDLKSDQMTHSIPASVNVVDVNGDGFADRMYLGDMAAQLWRFDIYNGNKASELVTGGVIASLGAKGTTPSTANTRRFYNAPDAALLQGSGNRPFINIGIGSGYRGHPLSIGNQDRFYSIRDYRPFSMMTQDQYKELKPITDDQLDDITTDLAPALDAKTPGWKLQLNDPSYRGEKVLSSSTTLQNAIFFTTYTPSASAASNTCSVASGSNRAYAISAFDGSPIPPQRAKPTDPVPTPTRKDRYTDLGQTGIAPEVTLLFPDNGEDDDEGEEKKDQVRCLAGVELLKVCKDLNSRIKTYWRQTDAN